MVVVVQVHHKGSLLVDGSNHYFCPSEPGVRDTLLGGRHHVIPESVQPSLELSIVIEQVSNGGSFASKWRTGWKNTVILSVPPTELAHPSGLEGSNSGKSGHIHRAVGASHCAGRAVVALAKGNGVGLEHPSPAVMAGNRRVHQRQVG